MNEAIQTSHICKNSRPTYTLFIIQYYRKVTSKSLFRFHTEELRWIVTKIASDDFNNYHWKFRFWFYSSFNHSHHSDELKGYLEWWAFNILLQCDISTTDNKAIYFDAKELVSEMQYLEPYRRRRSTRSYLDLYFNLYTKDVEMSSIEEGRHCNPF